MSMLGGLGGGGSSYTPSGAPKPPKRSDKDVMSATMRAYKDVKRRDSYIKASFGGGAPAPTQSYTAQMFSASPGGF